jgi:Zn-dependent metalloprotease
MHGMTRTTLGAMIALALAMPAAAGASKSSVAADQLAARTGARITLSPATGAVRFAKAPKGKALANAGAQKRSEHSMAFLKANGRAFGLRDAAAELKLVGESRDMLGDARVGYVQTYRGLPVFGSSLAAHYDKQGNLKVVNGTIIPDIDLDASPRKAAADAHAVALKQVSGAGVTVRSTQLMVFRAGLAKGVPGSNHLAYEVEVGNGGNIREFVYVDAHTGAKIDQITGIHEGLDRRAYNAGGATAPGPTYPNAPYWVEGDAFPTPIAEANNMITSSKETYDLFFNAFGRDGFDGAGKKMDAIFNRGNSCPNASWNGTFISFCPGLTTDDVTAHEWAHAYTQYTHGLIYQWQSGALNEAYSDIWGETVDRINGQGGDTPFAQREEGACSVQWGTPPATLVVNSPAPIAGDYAFGRASFGVNTGIFTGDVEVGNDGVGVGSDACTALVGFTPGKIALVDRGVCSFTIKVKNAQLAGATAVIVADNVTAAVAGMSGVDATITIPSVRVTLATGNLFKANTPNVTIAMPASTDDSVRWLVGEDVNSGSLVGALRDMWNPTCFGDPGKVTDKQYYCAAVANNTTDQGGVHFNSGVPNHAFALLVDGGTFNGQTVGAIGLTKAAQIYFRAQSVYQHPASDFVDHADALEQSCSDLTGAALPDLQTGGASGEVISAADCGNVAKAILAVQLRTPPTQCGFEPVLFQNAPPLCPAGTTPTTFFASNFDAGDSTIDRWSWDHEAVNPATFIPRDWQLVGAGALPDGRTGRGFWAADPTGGACSVASPNHAGVISLYSPIVTVAKSVSDARLTFEHWVATEAGWDGGNLKISVNGGPWTLVQDTDYTFNGYNGVTILGNTNPMKGQPVFTGTDGGSVSGSWGRSIVNLAPYATPGSKVQLRFDLGTDECGGSFGWFLDDVNMYTCKKKK